MANKSDENVEAKVEPTVTLNYKTSASFLVIEGEKYDIKNNKVTVKLEHVQKVQEHIKMIGG